jgi:hypothetical protein
MTRFFFNFGLQNKVCLETNRMLHPLLHQQISLFPFVVTITQEFVKEMMNATTHVDPFIFSFF